MTYRKKLIEVAMPLEAINRESAREKSIRHGHPSTLHLWWARRPLAACRAVLFGQLVDDPGSVPEEFPTEEAQDRERGRLHRLIERLVPWEATRDEGVLNEARREIARSIARWRTDRGENEAVDARMRFERPTPDEVKRYLAEKAPPIHDPFAGGGSIPLEAQRLGLRAIATDLNPVAVLINKALIEIPPRFAGLEPVNPEWRSKPAAERALKTWKGAEGLAEDVRYYGRWMRDEVETRIGHLYPKVTVTEEMAKGRPDLEKYVGRELTVIAWLWARTVTCPNPACGATMPLAASYWLSKKKHRQAWVEPQPAGKAVRFRVVTGNGAPPDPPKLDRATAFRCECCGQNADLDYVKAEGIAGRMSQQLMAIVLEGDRERVFAEPSPDHEATAKSAEPLWRPDQDLPHNPRDYKVPLYGLKKFGDLFTPRQLVALTTFSDLVDEARQRVQDDAQASGLSDNGRTLDEGGAGRGAYSSAIATFLAITLDKVAEASSTICTWSSAQKNELVVSTFRRQALPMTWDFAEANVLADSSGSIVGPLSLVSKAVIGLPVSPESTVFQRDAIEAGESSKGLVATDPPYYDNIGYADLSDFFYVWLRGSLREVFPSLFGTMLTPKAPELIATPYRDRTDGKSPEEFFEEGLRGAFSAIRRRQVEGQPVTVFYAFKQAESDDDGQSTASTGWDTMLTGLLSSGLSIEATWPVRTERGGRSIGIGTNALASSIVLTCRPRHEGAPLGPAQELCP
jgi:putative DNA methylase